jgi:hypothetical protein
VTTRTSALLSAALCPLLALPKIAKTQVTVSGPNNHNRVYVTHPLFLEGALYEI